MVWNLVRLDIALHLIPFGVIDGVLDVYHWRFKIGSLKGCGSGPCRHYGLCLLRRERHTIVSLERPVPDKTLDDGVKLVLLAHRYFELQIENFQAVRRFESFDPVYLDLERIVLLPEPPICATRPVYQLFRSL